MPKLNCQEVQNLLEAFHDNELDGVTSLSIQEHLDGCPDCRRQWRWLCEVEASLQRLSESTPSATQDLRRRILQPTSLQPSVVLAFFRMHRRMTGVVSLVLLFALTSIVLLTEWTRADVMLFVRDSVKMAEKALPVDLRTSNAEEAEQWLKNHLGFAPTVPDPSGFKLVGARSCHINREAIGLLLFERDGQSLSCYVRRASMTALRGFDETTPQGIKLGTCEGRHVVAWDAGDVSYLLVADLPKDALLAVADEVANSASPSLKQ
jgi:anti-sigma factor RsiW